MSALAEVGLLKRKALSCRDADLPVDEVEASDELGDGVLDLQAGVHFQEIELQSIRVDDEFNSTGVVITNCVRGRHGSLTHLLP